MAKEQKSPTGNEGEVNQQASKTILVVSAPGGPRRRCGRAFGPVPVEIPISELGDNAEDIINELRTDPLLKVDGRVADPEPAASAE